MKKLLELFCIAILCAGLCAAQRGRGRGPAGPTRVEGEAETINLFTALLDLKDPQSQTLRTIFDTALQDAQPIRQKMDAGKDSLFEAVRSGKSDEETGRLAAEQANLSSQMMALAAQTVAKIYRLLTPEQHEKADSFLYDRVLSLLESKPVIATTGQPPAPPVR